MANILLATFGSLGDLHPMIALGLELKRRGHHMKFASMDFYREKIESLGFEYAPMSPHLSPNDIANMPELVSTLGKERKEFCETSSSPAFPKCTTICSPLRMAAMCRSPGRSSTRQNRLLKRRA